VKLEGKVVIVTGGASGIGAALCRRFATEEPAGIVVVDRDEAGSRAGAEAVAADVEACGVRAQVASADVSVEAEVRRMVTDAEEAFGPVDLLCQNAGIARGGGADASDKDWADSWAVNFMAHVYGARAVLPSMIERGEGYLLHTCSAAGLLTNPGAAPYTATKHAAVAFAEWLSIHHRHQGIKVSALCPQGVRTQMALGDPEGAKMLRSTGDILEPEVVADVVVKGLDEERFLILPHPEVGDYERMRTADRDRWLAGMNSWITGLRPKA
jgi:NAD(P)-dependent dehydrogenase (short-subunit alcohol dehydrogenase family)